ncbi:Trehalose-6-P synthase/phosphatase complex subunit [Recurvomyces mirabilis]|nr:Trehalose-6-P synthase/phosphatase complex subunit [Recurvomyces mirabilis]
MATHNVSLFLPHTVAFTDTRSTAASSRRQSPPPLSKRHASTTDLPTHKSFASLFNGPDPPETPSIALNEEFFSSKKVSTRAKSGDLHGLVSSEAQVAEWGKQAIFNQPKSRAGPLPSSSVLDFAKVHQEAERKRLQETKRSKRSPPSRGSRAVSRDRTLDGKSWDVQPAVQGNGGLTNAVRAAAEAGDIDTNFIGTVGFPTDSLSEDFKEEIHDRLLSDHESQVVWISDKDMDGHYTHYCKTILWPIFHYQVPDHPKSKAYADHSWEFYRNINQAFAEKVVESYKRGDTIWIHDYHLLLVPAMVRQKLPEAQIGFFLHTAFPSSEVFRCLSTRKALLEGMLGANLVAFQTEEYAQHFLQTCSRLLTVEATVEGVQLENHFVNVTCQPIGLNLEAIGEARKDDEVGNWMKIINELFPNKKIIVARDKLDNVRGVRQKLLAYELFLNKYPEWREKVVLIQVVGSTSKESELMATVGDICRRIDSIHSSLANRPLVFLQQDMDLPNYLAMLTVANAFMITALRDGMNLAAHEYICCQDGTSPFAGGKKYSPLILSEFTGSSAVLGDGQLMINPWDYQQQARAIKQALEMDDDQKFERWSKMHKIVTTQTGGRWAHQLKDTLDKVYAEHHERASTSVPRMSITKVTDKYKAAGRRVFIIDYEGTLAPHRTSTGIPLSSPQRVLDGLESLMADSKNIVYVMSGRGPEELESTFRTLPSLGLIAENGCFLREYGAQHSEWQVFVDQDETAKWKGQARGILDYFQTRLEGSYIEERHCSLFFRYGKSGDQDGAVRFAGECADQINTSCGSMGIHAVPIPKAVLIEQVHFSKRSAATHIFDTLRTKATARGHPVPEFLLVAGDDREDEIIFQWANELGEKGTIRDVFTVSVGRRNTVAGSTITQGATGLLHALLKLGKSSSEGMEGDYVNRGTGTM